MSNFKATIYPQQGDKFTVSYLHPLTKRRLRKSFSNKNEASKYKHELEKGFNSCIINSYEDATIEKLLLKFRKERSKASFLSNKAYMNDFYNSFRDFRLDDLTSITLKEWLDLIQKENKIRPISMRKIKCDVDQFFNYLIDLEILSSSPLKEVYYKIPTPSLKARNILSPSEVFDLLNAAKKFSPGYFYPIIRVFVETGAKTQEVIDLEWRDLNLEEKFIKFNKTKSSQERIIEISEELCSILSGLKRKSGYLFLTYYKEPFTKSKIAIVVNEFKSKGSFKANWCPSDLRHSYAVNFLSNSGDMKELQYILGHKSIYDTQRLYKDANALEIGKYFDPETATIC